MADVGININELPGVDRIRDDALFVAEQLDEAVKVTGLQFKQIAVTAIEPEVAAVKSSSAAAQAAASNAQQLAQQASDAATGAGDYATQAEAAVEAAKKAAESITGMTVSAETLGSDEQATADWTVENGKGHLALGIPKGRDGTGGEGGGGVSSFNNRTGAVMPRAGDYKAADITFIPGTTWLSSTSTQGAIAELAAKLKDGGTGGGSGGSVDLTDVVKVIGGAELTLPDVLGDGPYELIATEDTGGSGGGGTGGGGSSTAEHVSYDNKESGLAADNVQKAIDELSGKIGEGGIGDVTVKKIKDVLEEAIASGQIVGRPYSLNIDFETSSSFSSYFTLTIGGVLVTNGVTTFDDPIVPLTMTNIAQPASANTTRTYRVTINGDIVLSITAASKEDVKVGDTISANLDLLKYLGEKVSIVTSRT